MRKITTCSKKYDGTIRDQGEAYLVAETAEAFTLLTLPKAKYWLPKKQAWYEAPDGLLQIFCKQDWYNVWHICENQSYGNLMYINIAIPATLQNGIFQWVDLDLDYRVNLDHSFEQIDRQDFEENKQLMGYAQDLIMRVEQTCLNVETGLRQKSYPFDHEQQVKQYFQFIRLLRNGTGTK